MEQRKQAEKSLALVRDYRAVFDGSQGRKVLYDLMVKNHVLSHSFSKSDPYETSFKEGERNAVLRILALLKVNPADLMQRIEEESNNE